jgi:beta-xylosidase
VLAKGTSDVNGPHQGGWVNTPNGEDWFVHFQDRGAYGRIVHLQPMRWRDGWPVMGTDADGDGTGNPVSTYRRPAVAVRPPPSVPQTSDTFDGTELGLQWQWQANPRREWWSLSARPGWLRLEAAPMPAGAPNLWAVSSLLLQKLPAPAFTATTHLSFEALGSEARAGLVVMGLDYAYLAVRRTANRVELTQMRVRDADRGSPEHGTTVPLDGTAVRLRVAVSAGGVCRFSWSRDGAHFTPIGDPFTAREGKWIGAKVGLFAIGSAGGVRSGHADFDAFVMDR